MILTRAIIGGMAVMVILSGGVALTERWKNKRLTVEVKNQEDAIVAYEQLLKVVPYNALSGEWKGDADEEIRNALDNNDSISNGRKRL